MWQKKWQYLALWHMDESIIDYVLAVDGRWCCPQLTGGETEAHKGKVLSLTC